MSSAILENMSYPMTLPSGRKIELNGKLLYTYILVNINERDINYSDEDLKQCHVIDFTPNTFYGEIVKFKNALTGVIINSNNQRDAKDIVNAVLGLLMHQTFYSITHLTKKVIIKVNAGPIMVLHNTEWHGQNQRAIDLEKIMAPSFI